MKVACGRGLPELPPRDKWPIRFLLASEELWALEAILKQIKEKPAETKREVLPTGLSGMLLYRLWQHGFYTNDSWDKNPKCKKVHSTQCMVSSKKGSANQIAERDSSVDLRSLIAEKNVGIAQSEDHVARSTYHVEPERSDLTTNGANYTNGFNYREHREEQNDSEMRGARSEKLVEKEIKSAISNQHSTIKRIVPILERQRLHDLAMVAQRKLAMLELDQWVVNWNKEHFGDNKEKWVRPIIIKGGATSRLYYPDESLRLSSDIDVLMPKGMITDLFDKDEVLSWHLHEVGKKNFSNFCVEVHRVISRIPFEWGAYHDIISECGKHYGKSLTVLPVDHFLKLICIHFTTHCGGWINDIIDFMLILKEESLKDISLFDSNIGRSNYYQMYLPIQVVWILKEEKEMERKVNEIWASLSYKHRIFQYLLIRKIFFKTGKFSFFLIHKISWGDSIGKSMIESCFRKITHFLLLKRCRKK